MGSVTSLFLRKVVRVAGQAVDGAALLRAAGLDPEAPDAVQQRIPDTTYYDLLEQIVRQTGMTDLPLKAGASMTCDDYGAFGLAWKAAPTLRDSFARAERYWRLLTSVAEYELIPSGQDAWFMLHRAGQRRLGMRISNEATLASTVSIIRQVSPQPFAPLEVHLKHKAPASTAAHQAYFGCPVIGASDRDALLVPGAALARANRLGDEGITRFLLGHLDQELQNVTQDLTIGQQARDVVARALSAGIPRIGEIARRMGLGERTLQRRLGEEGLTFQGMIDDARRDLAEGLLVQSDYSLAEIAFLTGFSEQSAFTRAFRRWRGKTPAAYREGGGGA